MSAAATALCICVDDFGLHAGINDAALRLAAERRISAIGCMVQGRAWLQGAIQLRKQTLDAADVGLHFNLTEALGADMPGASLKALILRSHLGLLDRGALRLAVRQQLERFEDMMDRAPDFVDGHQHVHQLPMVRDALVEELCRRYPGHRPWLRVSAASPRAVAGRFDKARVIDCLGAPAMRRLAARNGLKTNASLLGVYGFDADAAGYAARLEAWLRAAAPGDLLMCHPATRAEAGDPIGPARRTEYAVLAGPDFAPILARANVRVVRLSQRFAGR